jgi:hypothetical protein
MIQPSQALDALTIRQLERRSLRLGHSRPRLAQPRQGQMLDMLHRRALKPSILRIIGSVDRCCSRQRRRMIPDIQLRRH